MLGNCHDRFAVTAYEADGDEVVGHIPREISPWSAPFLDHGGSIEGLLTGVKRHSREAGGIEIPCELTFIGKKMHIAKIKRLVEGLNSTVIYICIGLIIGSNHNMEMFLTA